MREQRNTDDIGRALAHGLARHSIEAEASISRGPIQLYPVHLEPTFAPVDLAQTFVADRDRTLPSDTDHLSWSFRHVRLAPADAVDWRRAESLLTRLGGCTGVLVFELWIDHEVVRVFIGAAPEEIDFVAAAWSAIFPECALIAAPDPAECMNRDVKVLVELVSPAGYDAQIHASQVVSPWASVFHLHQHLAPGDIAVCQMLYTPVRSAWGENIPRLLAMQRALGPRAPYGQTVTPKHTDEPLFASVIRIMSTSDAIGPGIESFTGTFSAEGKPFLCRTLTDYRAELSEAVIADMCRQRLTFVPGQLLTAHELSLFVHLPNEESGGGLDFALLRGLPVPHKLRLTTGTPLGMNAARGVPIPVYSPVLANECGWTIGQSRSGKTTALEHRFLYLAKRGGVCFIDPHRTTALKLPGMLKGIDPARVLFLDFDAARPIAFNAFRGADPRDYGRLALEGVNSFKSLLGTESFQRTNHVLAMGLFGLLVLGENLVTLPPLFSPEGDSLRRHVIAHAQNEAVVRFFHDDYRRLGPTAFAPLLNRLTAMLLDEFTYRTFSQSENAVDLAGAMNDEKIVIIAPPANIESSAIVGGLLLAHIKHAAFRRIGTTFTSHHFHVFVDEFHRFLTSGAAIESLANETAKGAVSIHVANQETGQLPTELLKALLSMPSVFVFNVNYPDARLLTPLFQGRVTPETLSSQATGAVHARIGQDIVSYQSPAPYKEYDDAVAAAIIAHSEATYYATAPPVVQSRVKRKIEAF